MGLFGRKKTPEEILAEGRAQYVKGDLIRAFRDCRGEFDGIFDGLKKRGYF